MCRVFFNFRSNTTSNLSDKILDPQRTVTIAELKTKYTAGELSSYPGDDALRFAAFAPLFENLYKLIYYEAGFYAIVSVTDLSLTPERLSGVAQITKKIIRPDIQIGHPEQPWRFSCHWGGLRLVGRAINARYISFTLWTDAALVAEVERLVDEDKCTEAIGILRKEN
jgi:hypothetical protein